MIQNIFYFFEKRSFGVCTYLAGKFSLSLSKVRMFFIYTSFLAVGAPIVFYFFAFLVLDIRKFIKAKRRVSVFDI